jgi:mRNA-degrading endonuclease RelE of RelBE toxin-antitoxin system
MITTETFLNGSVFSIAVVVKDGHCTVRDFLEQEIDSNARNKVLALLNFIVERGTPHNEEKFRLEGEGIFALKTSEVRLYGFFDGRKLIVLTHGFKKFGKGGQKVQARERKRAEQIRAELLRNRST